MPDPLSWLSPGLAELRERALVRARREITPLGDGWCEVDGRRLRDFSANDYLNLASDPRLIAAARQALDSAGTGARASALVSGRSPWHARLERRLAEFEKEQSAVLFPSGYAANCGAVAALAGRGDLVLSDQFNHASLIDGCRLSRAEVGVYTHLDLDDLERRLSSSPATQRRLIVTDSLFSMDGDTAPLGELCDLAERYGAVLLVDEAPATGVCGEQGRGVAEQQGVADRVHVRVGTLSKAVGALGGFVCGSRLLIDWLWNRARTQIFSTALPPSVCAAAAAGIEVIQSEPWRRTKLQHLAKRMRDKLADLGLKTSSSGSGPIIPIRLHDPDAALRAAERLEQLGFLVAIIRPPTVPEGTSRLRITLSAAHSGEEIDELAQALREVC